jgi:hypothetical protein
MSEHLSKAITHRPISAIEFVDLFLGAEIGSGMSRQVYEFNLDKTMVVKHETGDAFQNMIEWEIWKAVQETPMKKWFAPCHAISPNGQFLIQSRVEQIPRKQYPKKIPDFFHDTKYQNFGMLNGKFVCFDYGTMNLIRENWNKKMVKVDWWEA